MSIRAQSNSHRFPIQCSNLRLIISGPGSRFCSPKCSLNSDLSFRYKSHFLINEFPKSQPFWRLGHRNLDNILRTIFSRKGYPCLKLNLKIFHLLRIG